MSWLTRWRRIVADAITIGAGTSGDNIADLQHWQDGNEYNLAEAAATPGLTFTVTFENVNSILAIFFLGWYNGTHHVNIEIYNYTDAAWEIIDTLIDGADDESHMVPIVDDTNYISSNQAQIRFNHPSAGNNTHDLYIGYLTLLF